MQMRYMLLPEYLDWRALPLQDLFVLVMVEASQIYGVQTYLDGVEGYEEDISKLVDLLLSILSGLDRI